MSKVQDVITAKLIEKINSTNRLPWERPWELRENVNYTSKRAYNGINRLMTSYSPFSCPYWITYRKCAELGGHVLKGQKALPIVFVTEQRDKETNELLYTGLRYTQVFNLEQTTLTIPEKEESIAAKASISVLLDNPRVPEIEFGDSRAAYAPSLDKIILPYRSQYDNPAHFYSTMFHELIHSTGHHTRLNRPGIVNPINMQSISYSFEELIAELGAALMCYKCGIFDTQVEQSSIAYIQGWKSKLSANTDWIIKAAAQAEKAVKYLLENQIYQEGT
jgi:antirestriction protein ArdC